MTHSLNEIEGMAKKAGRGAGLSWGMSEEAARATRWLCSHGQGGAGLLADVLTQNDQVAHAQVCPVSLDGVWQARSGLLCPLAAGCALNDCADRLADGTSIVLSVISHPMLIVPFAGWAAIHINAPVSVVWQNVRVETDGYRILVSDPSGEADVSRTASLTCRRIDVLDGGATAPALRGAPKSEDWDCLCAFAQRTYAPATALSRRLGAGAGATDND